MPRSTSSLQSDEYDSDDLDLDAYVNEDIIASGLVNIDLFVSDPYTMRSERETLLAFYEYDDSASNETHEREPEKIHTSPAASNPIDIAANYPGLIAINEQRFKIKKEIIKTKKATATKAVLCSEFTDATQPVTDLQTLQKQKTSAALHHKSRSLEQIDNVPNGELELKAIVDSRWEREKSFKMKTVMADALNVPDSYESESSQSDDVNSPKDKEVEQNDGN